MAIEKKRSIRKDITPRRWIVVDFGFWHTRGNRRPHFTITGSVHDKDTGDRRDSFIESCGCIHEQIQEHFPELAHLIRWHLMDDDGTPMHYEANAAHWLEFHHGISQFEGHHLRDGRTPLDAFKSTVVFREGQDALGFLLDPIPVDPPAGIIFEQYADSKEGKRARCAILRERVKVWCAARADSLAADFRRDMEAAGLEFFTEREIGAA